jgi:hypothetical protein
VRGHFEQERKGADSGLPFNLLTFYDGCGGLQCAEAAQLVVSLHSGSQAS